MRESAPRTFENVDFSQAAGSNFGKHCCSVRVSAYLHVRRHVRQVGRRAVVVHSRANVTQRVGEINDTRHPRAYRVRRICCTGQPRRRKRGYRGRYSRTDYTTQT